MTRITYRLRTEPIYRTIKIILMSHPSLHTHIPECNSLMTHNQILCRSNHPHPSLTTTLSHCIITLLQEKPATLHQPQCTENQEYKLHTYSATVTWTGNKGEGTFVYDAYARDYDIALGLA